MRATYATTQSAGVRRQADTHRDAASLANLISEIHSDAAAITKDWWIGLWEEAKHDELMQLRAEESWDARWASADGTHLDPAIPGQDLAQLEREAAKVKAYVDWHVAHTDRRAAATTVTLTVATCTRRST